MNFCNNFAYGEDICVGFANGKNLTKPTAYVDISFQDGTFMEEFDTEFLKSLQVIYMNKKYAIVGRDILNKMKVVFEAEIACKVNCTGCHF